MKILPSSHDNWFYLLWDGGGVGEGELHARSAEDAGEGRTSERAALGQLGGPEGARVADGDRLVEDDVLTRCKWLIVCDAVF